MAPLPKGFAFFIGVRPQHNYYSCQSIVKKGLKMLIDTRTKSRAYGRHSAVAPFFASTWLHSLPYAEVSCIRQRHGGAAYKLTSTTFTQMTTGPVGCY